MRSGRGRRDGWALPWRRCAWAAPLLVLVLSGCARYRARPLPAAADLKPDLAALDLTLPATAPGVPGRRIDPAAGISLDALGLLAARNDPALRTEAARLALARAGLQQAATLPNPQLGLGFGALISGPASMPAYTASLSQDLSALITYRPRVAAARANLGAVDAALLWQEWQVAQAARLLGARIAGGAQALRYRRRALALLSAELRDVAQATRAGNLGLAAEAPLVAATAQAGQALATARLAQLTAWQQLDALLGLLPTARFRILPPRLRAPPARIGKLVAGLAARRPDLIGLRLGYRAADETLRAAVLGQIPALVFGVSGTSDTSGVVSIGPDLTIGLPLFNRNQAAIAASRATRALLRAQYRAELDASIGAARATVRRLQLLWADAARAGRQAQAARRLARGAARAYAAGNIDQRALVDYQTTALDRALEATDFRTRVVADELALDVDLGRGLPRVRIAPVAGGMRPGAGIGAGTRK